MLILSPTTTCVAGVTGTSEKWFCVTEEMTPLLDFRLQNHYISWLSGINYKVLFVSLCCLLASVVSKDRLSIQGRDLVNSVEYSSTAYYFLSFCTSIHTHPSQTLIWAAFSQHHTEEVPPERGLFLLHVMCRHVASSTAEWERETAGEVHSSDQAGQWVLRGLGLPCEHVPHTPATLSSTLWCWVSCKAPSLSLWGWHLQPLTTTDTLFFKRTEYFCMSLPSLCPLNTSCSLYNMILLWAKPLEN